MRNDAMRRTLLLALILGLGACNTIAGVGDDVSAGARKVQSWF